METIKNWWTNFSQKHKLVAQFVKFYAFSLFVTVLQYLLLTFLPGLFYNLTDWCSIPCQLIHLNLGPVDTYVFNYPVTGDATGGGELWRYGLFCGVCHHAVSGAVR